MVQTSKQAFGSWVSSRSQDLSNGPPPHRPKATVIESEQAWTASAKHGSTQCILRDVCSVVNYTASTRHNPALLDPDPASIRIYLRYSATNPRESPTDLNPQATGSQPPLIKEWSRSWITGYTPSPDISVSNRQSSINMTGAILYSHSTRSL